MNDELCHDKNGRQIQAGDQVRITTVGALNGVYTVVRGEDGMLYFEYELPALDHKGPTTYRELVFGFYPRTMEVLSK